MAPLSKQRCQREFYLHQGFNEFARYQTPPHRLGDSTSYMLVKERDANSPPS
jgi:hypothetical protein